MLPCSFTLLSLPLLELKHSWPVWKLFENLRFSLVNRDFRAKPIFKPCPEMTHSKSNRRDPSENFFLSSRGRDNKVNEHGKFVHVFTTRYLTRLLKFIESTSQQTHLKKILGFFLVKDLFFSIGKKGRVTAPSPYFREKCSERGGAVRGLLCSDRHW